MHHMHNNNAMYNCGHNLPACQRDSHTHAYFRSPCVPLGLLYFDNNDNILCCTVMMNWKTCGELCKAKFIHQV